MIFSINKIILLSTIYIVPVILPLYFFQLSDNIFYRSMILLISLFEYPIVFTFLSVFIAKIFIKDIKKGIFKRSLELKEYRVRRYYGLIFTSLYYSPFLYHLILNITWLKRVYFKGMGMKTTGNFTIYPDTWIRDLCLCSIGENAYISNKATIGTNIVMDKNRIYVNGIEISDNVIIGHSAMIGCGVKIGHNSSIGVLTAIGLSSIIGFDCKIGANNTIGHGILIGNNVITGKNVHIGDGVKISDNIVINDETIIPQYTVINSQDILSNFIGILK